MAQSPPRDRSPTTFVRTVLSAARETPEAGMSFGPETLRRRSRVERVEEAATIVLFLLMFVTLVIGVFWRYVLDSPLIWTVNLGTIAFIWTVMVGGGLPNWDESHIQFDLVYNRLPPAWQRFARILGNTIIVVTFAMVIPGTVSYLQFQGSSRVTGLPIGFDIAFGSVLIFLVATVLHRGRLLVDDLRAIWRERRRQT